MSQCRMVNVPDVKEFRNLYKANQDYFKESGNFFYMQENDMMSEFPTNGNVCYGTYDGLGSKLDNRISSPGNGHGAALWLCDSKDIGSFKKECEAPRRADGQVTFKTKDGHYIPYATKKENGTICFTTKDGKSEGYARVFNNLDGSQCVGFGIKNAGIPFSKHGETSYPYACEENGSLPNMVSTDKVLDLVPDRVLDLCGVPQRSKEKEAKARKQAAINKFDQNAMQLQSKLDQLKDPQKKGPAKKGTNISI